jgi:putative ABC transport system permease protein
VRNGAAGSVEAKLVGVIANIKYSGLDAAPDDTVYRPLRQQPWPLLFLVARTTGGPGTLAGQLRTEIAAIDRAILVSSVATMDAIMSDASAQPRFRTALLLSFAASALTIAAVGLYGMVAYTVSRRTSEIGIRMALGASRTDVLIMVFREAAGLTLIGLVAGILASLAATRILTSLLFGVEPTDGASYAIAALMLVVVSSVAALLPAIGASRLDPLIAIRTD